MDLRNDSSSFLEEQFYEISPIVITAIKILTTDILENLTTLTRSHTNYTNTDSIVWTYVRCFGVTVAVMNLSA